MISIKSAKYFHLSKFMLLACLAQITNSPALADNATPDASSHSYTAQEARTDEALVPPVPEPTAASNGADSQNSEAHYSSSQNQNALDDELEQDKFSSRIVRPKSAKLHGGITKLERKHEQVQSDQTSAADNMNDRLARIFATLGISAGMNVRLNGNLQTLGSSVRRYKPMTPEEYRQMEYGVLGVAVTKWEGGTMCTVRQVLPDCPAEIAGIRPGDIIVQANKHVFTADDDQKVYWRMIAGKAGTPVDIFIKRDGEPLTFHLTRMNIEDIKNDNIRRLFEMKLSLIGPPTTVDDEAN
jgi:C-terminal processing protease CtpA/Prc